VSNIFAIGAKYRKPPLTRLKLFRSRQQPFGCAPPGRTSCDGQSALPRPLRAEGLFRSRQQPFGCAPLGRTSCGGQSALPQHVPCFGEGVHHKGRSGMENGPPQADELFDQHQERPAAGGQAVRPPTNPITPCCAAGARPAGALFRRNCTACAGNRAA